MLTNGGPQKDTKYGNIFIKISYIHLIQIWWVNWLKFEYDAHNRPALLSPIIELAHFSCLNFRSIDKFKSKGVPKFSPHQCSPKVRFAGICGLQEKALQQLKAKTKKLFLRMNKNKVYVVYWWCLSLKEL